MPARTDDAPRAQARCPARPREFASTERLLQSVAKQDCLSAYVIRAWALPLKLEIGEFVEARNRRWLVEGVEPFDAGHTLARLSCIDDDALGDVLEVLWDAEIDARRLEEDPWAQLAKNGTDEADVFAAFLKPLLTIAARKAA